MKRSYFTIIRLCIGLLSACVFLGLANPKPAAAFDCGAPHCYGIASWSEQPEYFGAYTDATQVEMSCLAPTCGFIDDEVWLIDNHTAGCPTNPFGLCWIETGTILNWWNSRPNFFWANAVPGIALVFAAHFLGNADQPGTVDHYMIIKEGRNNARATYQIWVYNDSHSTLYNATTGGNDIVPKRIDIGQELFGTGGAVAGPANFERNIWAVQPLGSEFVFWYNAQSDDGGVTSGNPPFGSWTIHPSSPGPEGGRFTTHCCS